MAYSGFLCTAARVTLLERKSDQTLAVAFYHPQKNKLKPFLFKGSHDLAPPTSATSSHLPYSSQPTLLWLPPRQSRKPPCDSANVPSLSLVQDFRPCCVPRGPNSSPTGFVQSALSTSSRQVSSRMPGLSLLFKSFPIILRSLLPHTCPTEHPGFDYVFPHVLDLM